MNGQDRQTKIGLSAGKVIATVFWDFQGIFLIDYLQNGKKITGIYYPILLDCLKERLKQKRSRLTHEDRFVGWEGDGHYV